ncbi:MAG: TrmJ/YjtD family RNA methyltransferase [Gammaproteobacteria bacterium]|nr:TrmJ/YjtD family RNA methyltransferase [Gammaproteobacteria bacterium]
MSAKIRVVLVETSHPGNIGAAARAMKNMGLDGDRAALYLVKPANFPNEDATVRASGAVDLLDNAVVCDTLDEALVGTTLVFGASARTRSLPWPIHPPRVCAEKISLEPDGSEVALVFGRERSGLTNEELERCNTLLHIPTNPDFSSLNLGAAVQVVAYELLMARDDEGATKLEQVERDSPLASADDIERLFGHLEKTLVDIDFLDPENPRHMMRRLRRLFNRVELEQVEINILRGILTAVDKNKRVK